MKKFGLFLFCLLQAAVFATPIQECGVDKGAFIELLHHFEISLDVVEHTQRVWLRGPNQERWEMDELGSEMRLFVLDWADQNGLLAARSPTLKHYDKALILGATTKRMEGRLNYLKDLWERGVRFDEVVWLVGDRPLDVRVDDFTDKCSTESEAACILWQEAILPFEMRNLPVLFVASGMKNESGVRKRPNTQDTVIDWLKISPNPCTVLLISNQPVLGYQFGIVKKALPEEFLFDVVGPGVSLKESLSAAMILDSMARWLYVEGGDIFYKSR